MQKLSLVLVDDIPTINGKIVNAFRLHLTSVFKRAAIGIQRRIGEVCELLIRRTPEFQSLLSGDLLGELGVPDVEGRLDAVLRTIKNSCDVEVTPLIQAGDVLTGGLVLKMIRADFMDVMEISGAEYLTQRGVQIPWLNWILTQGDRIIVVGYDVKLNLSTKEKARSRTGLGLMIPGSGWRVDPDNSGVLDDNFITRAFNPAEVEKLLLKIIEEEIVSRL
jgi:hypothetical protein